MAREQAFESAAGDSKMAVVVGRRRTPGDPGSPKRLSRAKVQPPKRVTGMSRKPTATDCEAVLELIGDGSSLRQACATLRFDAGHTHRAMMADRQLASDYDSARQLRADLIAEDVIDIAMRTLSGEYDPQRARVAISALTWAAGKMHPRAWGAAVVAPVTPPAFDLRATIMKLADEEAAQG